MNYHNITHEDMLNGDGIRVVLWVSGCPHHCEECQNPETWSPNSGIEFDEEAKREIFNELSKDYVSGITFSGGDPLAVFNVHFVFDLMEQIKKHFPNKTIWVYTGYTFEELEECVSWTHAGIGRYSTYDEGVAKILPLIDVLVDGEYKKDLRDVNLKWRGSSNQRVIDVKKSLKEGKVVLHCE